MEDLTDLLKKHGDTRNIFIQKYEEISGKNQDTNTGKTDEDQDEDKDEYDNGNPSYDPKILKEDEYFANRFDSKLNNELIKMIESYDYYKGKSNYMRFIADGENNHYVKCETERLYKVDLYDSECYHSVNYPEYQPNANAINLLRNMVNKLGKYGFTIHDIKVNMDKYHDGTVSSWGSYCDAFEFLCSYSIYRFIVVFSDDCDIDGGILNMEKVYNTIDRIYYKYCLNIYNDDDNRDKWLLDNFITLLNCNNNLDYFNRVYQPYVDQIEGLSKLGYKVESNFNLKKWLEDYDLRINVYKFNMVFRVSYNGTYILIIPYKNRLYLTHSLKYIDKNDNNRVKKLQRYNDFYSYYNGIDIDFGIDINSFKSDYLGYNGVRVQGKVNTSVGLHNQILKFIDYQQNKGIWYEIVNKMAEFEKKMMGRLEKIGCYPDSGLDKYKVIRCKSGPDDKYNNNTQPYKGRFMFLLGCNSNILSILAVTCGISYPFDLMKVKICNDDLGYNLKCKLYTRNIDKCILNIYKNRKAIMTRPNENETIYQISGHLKFDTLEAVFEYLDGWDFLF